MKLTFCYDVQFDIEVEAEKVRNLITREKGLKLGDLLASYANTYEPRLKTIECDGIELSGVYNPDDPTLDEVIYE